MVEKRILTIIIIGYLVLGATYAFVTPVFEASDELWHYPMVKHLADGNPLPVQTFDPSQAGPWKQEASQPPLYYYLSAALTFWIDTSDISDVRWLNPHVDVGTLTEDGNTNLVVHDPDTNPWNGTILAIRLVRLFSVALGAVTVYLTYRIAREVVPNRMEIALGAAAVNGFTPMFLFISGAVNNDNLVIPLASLALLLMIRLVTNESASPGEKKYQPLILGLVIGLGALTKITAVGLLLLAAGTIFVERWKQRDRNSDFQSLLAVGIQAILRFILVLIPVLLIACWWYVRNINLYGDWSGWNAFIAVLGQRATPASLPQLWDERWGFMMSYWGLFGGLNIPMPVFVYHLLNVVAIISAVGLLLVCIKMIIDWSRKHHREKRSSGLFIGRILDFTNDHFALVICFLWSSAVVIGLIRWATTTWSSQGRLVFSAISPLSALFMVGLVGWLPQRLAKIAALSIGLILGIVSLLAPFRWIAPAYQVAPLEQTDKFRVVNEVFGDFISIDGYKISDSLVMPGDNLRLTVDWQMLRAVDEDWSVFVHLVDPILESPIAQRDMFPGQGLLPTSLIDAGERITDRYVLTIPDTAIAPAELTLAVGLYDYATNERVELEDGRTALPLAKISLQPTDGTLPNPVSYNFEDLFELSGFKLDKQRVNAGDTIDLKLYWTVSGQPDEDYTFFAQLVGKDTTRWASQDLPLQTTEWSEGDSRVVDMTFRIDENTPADIYPLIVGIYTRSATGSFERLQLKTDEGRLTDDFLNLAKVRVEGGE